MPRTLPLRINYRDCIVLVFLVIFNTLHVTDMANSNNNMDNHKVKESRNKDEPIDKGVNIDKDEEYIKSCPVDDIIENITDCSLLDYPCVKCNRSIDCIYGSFYNYTCNVRQKVTCNGPRVFNRTAMCRFCYQTEKYEHRCEQKSNCNSLASPLKFYLTNCTVSDNVICLGNRKFPKKVRCSWTAGTQWGTALVLALTLGGFGADRFYLGHWQEGIGKLFSFGGLGVWTLVDALLIGIHHLGPADGSVYL